MHNNAAITPLSLDDGQFTQYKNLIISAIITKPFEIKIKGPYQ